MARFLAEGFVVDDDNVPAPENVPLDSNLTNQDVLYEEWGSATHCNRARMFGRNETQPHLNNEPKTNDLLEWFLFFLPWKFFCSTIIPATNNIIEGSPISEGEFIRYIGIWLLMSTVHSWTCRRSFWSLGPINPFEGAPFRCNTYMSCTRFEKITKALKYTMAQKPMYVDKIFEVRELLQAFNQKMKQIFNSGWVVCLDVSSSARENLIQRVMNTTPLPMD